MYNERLANGQVSPGIKALWWSIRGVRAEREKAWRERNGKRKASLIFAMNDSVKWRFWSAGVLKVIGDTAQVTAPLVVKVRGSLYARVKHIHRWRRRSLPLPQSRTLGMLLGRRFHQLERASVFASLSSFYSSFHHGVRSISSIVAWPPVSSFAAVSLLRFTLKLFHCLLGPVFR